MNVTVNITPIIPLTHLKLEYYFVKTIENNMTFTTKVVTDFARYIKDHFRRFKTLLEIQTCMHGKSQVGFRK